ncbi:MAG: putative hydrolase of the alpha/beta superfamily [Rickettsiales bacterium]|jgi:alpha/beta superfamily hydrolase|nr:putative hydrolase of the alpha/beta superfamily [Rickettsiales bacterium]
MPEVIFNGPEGRIEGRYQHGTKDRAPAALILHPHPLHGGTMNNKVTYNLYHAFARHGFSVLRFNFRGVGRSQGKFDNGIGELSDAATALDWLQLQNPNATSFWIGGFSFGAWVGLQLMMRRPEIEGFITVAPPVGKYDFSFLSPCPASGLIVQGNQDSIVDEPQVAALAGRLNKQKNITVEYKMVEGADHFFREHLDTLNQHMDNYILPRLAEATAPKTVKRDRRRRQLPGA